MTNKKLNNTAFLGISYETVKLFGMRTPDSIRWQGEVYRWFLPTVVHYGISHLFINLLIQMVVGFMLESQMKWLRMAIFYFTVLITAEVFGSLCTPNKYASGADPIIFGLFGGMLGMVIIYWKRLGAGDNFCQRICFIFMIVVLMVIYAFLMYTISQSYANYVAYTKITFPDIFGCVGAFIVGLPAALFFLPPGDPRVNGYRATRYEQILAWIGLVVVIVEFILFVVLFFTVAKVDLPSV